MVQATALLTERICTTCCRSLPANAFRLHRRGGDRRRAQCKECHAKAMADWRAGRRRRQFREFLKRATDPKRPDDAISNLVQTVIRRVGGLDAFVDLWVGHLQSSPPGSAMSLRACEATIRLLYSHDLRQAPTAGRPEPMRSVQSAENAP